MIAASGVRVQPDNAVLSNRLSVNALVSFGMWLSLCGQPRGLGRLEAVEPDGLLIGLIGREGG
ncbi:hypothetical protein [Acidisphaera sp. S103]|uniref:hypothetical protein n=1 Tax=Acidisphaera sp. S103 TaxID=1747223 RepID=UPI00131DDD91|nr:hypothetical protein [Acidisphaera sp. S103]